MSPYFDSIEREVFVRLPNGEGTKIDVLCSGSKVTLQLGKGLTVAEGASLACEVKSMKAESFPSQEERMSQRQIPGHFEVADHSMVATTKDFADAGGNPRAAFREAGAETRRFLPNKSDLDSAVVRHAMRTES